MPLLGEGQFAGSQRTADHGIRCFDLLAQHSHQLGYQPAEGGFTGHRQVVSGYQQVGSQSTRDGALGLEAPESPKPGFQLQLDQLLIRGSGRCDAEIPGEVAAKGQRFELTCAGGLGGRMEHGGFLDFTI